MSDLSSVLSGWRGAKPPAGTLTGATPSVARGVDKTLIWVTVALLLWGLVMVYSASVAMPDNPRFARYAHTHFLLRHVLSIAVAASRSC